MWIVRRDKIYLGVLKGCDEVEVPASRVLNNG